MQASKKVEQLKKKNLHRVQTVAQNLVTKAEQEKRDYLERLKKQKDHMKTIEKKYNYERETEEKAQ